ncbi:MAG: YraN family protein [Panacagrimonas sp.]
MKGAREEDLALRYLELRGLKLVDRNVRAPGGELDLVMRDGAALAIVEVRKRAHRGYGSAAESVDSRKQSRIVQATRGLLARRPEFAKLSVRFDVVTLDADDRIEWIQAAFDAAD